MASRIKAHIAEVAITLFAERGYHGVSTRDVAKAARVTEGSIYRLFVTKKGLFDDVLARALRDVLDPAQFLLMIYENEQKQDIIPLLTAAILRWYSSLPASSARLLTQAYFLPEWREVAYAPIRKIMGILGTQFQQHGKNPGRKIDFTAAGQAPFLALCQYKISYAGSGSRKEEAAAVTALVHQWLRGILGSA